MSRFKNNIEKIQDWKEIKLFKKINLLKNKDTQRNKDSKNNLTIIDKYKETMTDRNMNL